MMPHGVPHLLEAMALVLAIALLPLRQPRACIAACALQSWVAALAAAWQGWVRDDPALYGLALVALAANGVLLPMALARIAGRLGSRAAAETGAGVFASLVAGFAVVVLAALTVRPLEGIAAGLAREDLAVALSVALLGLIVMTARAGALAPAVGLVVLENGLVLAAIGAPRAPLLAGVAVALAATAAAAFVAVVARPGAFAGRPHG